MLARYQWTKDKIVKYLKNRGKQPCFDQIQQVDIKDINRISAGYQGLLYTGYHELSPLGKILSISLKLNFTLNTLDCYGLSG